jgi:radical SAM superfamily enzyme YgiQ (UPF0313 family)
MNLLFLMCKTIHETWPLATDFSRYAYGFPSITYPQLIATIPGVNYRFFDGIAEPIGMTQYKELIGGHDIVVLSLQSAKIALNMEITVKLIKHLNPKAKIIMGGQHPTFYYKEWIERGVDFVVRGEGERTFPELIETIFGGGDFRKIEGLIFKDGDEIVINAEREFIPDLDQTPIPDWTSVDLWRYTLRMRPDGLTAAIETARGCNQRCTFCSTSAAWKNTQRYKSVGRIMEELNLLSKMNVKQMIVVDDNFGGLYERDIAILDGIIKGGYDVRLFGFIRVDTALAYPDLIEKAGRAGWRQAVVGFESLAPDRLSTVQKGYKKSLRYRDYKKAYDIFHRNGIFVLGQFIVGFPGENEDEVKTTIKHCNDICDCSTINPFKPIYGTKESQELLDSEDDLDPEALFYDLRYLPLYRREPVDKTAKFNSRNFFNPRYLSNMLSSDYLKRHYFRNIYWSSLKQMLAAHPSRVRDYRTSMNRKLTPAERKEKIISKYLDNGFLKTL